jgi:isoleucyl-tRNA synthetase
MDDRWNKLIKLRSEITKALEIARQNKIIGHPLEAEVQLQASGELADFIDQEWHTIKEISIVSGLSKGQPAGDALLVSEEIDGLTINVVPAAGQKCERCWTRSTTVGDNVQHPEICDRCAVVISHMDLAQEA